MSEQLSVVKDLVASRAQLRTATGEERQGAFDLAAERETNQGAFDLAAGHERKKIEKNSSELKLKSNPDRGSRDLQFWRSLDPMSGLLWSLSSEEFFPIFFHSCPPELIQA